MSRLQRLGQLLVAVAVCAIGTGSAIAQAARPRTYANPIDIDYRYNFEQHNEGISYRSGADPVIVVQGGRYYLFETIGDGYWESRDLARWQHITPTRWPLTDIVAPAVISVRDTIYLLPATTRPLPILMLTQPATGRVEFYNRLLPWLPMARDNEGPVFARPDSVQPGPWDPQFFHDPATERWFLYWNSSNVYPLHVIELDKSKQLAYKGTPRWLFGLEPDKHGWERFGRDHRDTTIKPFMEGAFMTKYGGRYYLQYGAPGTEYNVYATGVYVASDPFGPFTYAPYNPIAYKPGGFVQGAGHGNSFQDLYGNWWSTGTPWIGVNWNFERRIGLHPAGFDADGQMYVDTRFGDFPHWLPTKRWGASASLLTGWMLLSYRKPVTASSARDSFPASSITDENPRTFWVARRSRPGESLTIDLGRAYELRAIQVNYADYKSGLYGTDSSVYTQFRLQVSSDGRTWRSVADLSKEARRDRPNAYVELAAPTRARYVRYEHIHVGAANLAVSDIRVFGIGGGARPATPARLTARRDGDERNAVIAWDGVPNVVGYNVRWGISPSKLYQTYQRFADQGTTLELRALTVGQSYWVAIESFDENGVSTLSPPIQVAAAAARLRELQLARGLALADSLIAAAVGQTIPGAVLVVSQNGKIVHERSFGWAELNDFQGRRLPEPRPMRTSTLFDLASVTKVMATTMAVMKLVSDGRLDVDAPVNRYLPDFRGVHLDSITVRHLLTHSAGLVQWQPLYYHATNERETYDVIRRMPLQWGVGEGRHYSDLGFMLLGYIVERVAGQPLDRFVRDSLYAPLGLRSTTYLPKQRGFTDFAATEQGNAYEHHMVYDSTFGYRYHGDPTAWKGWREYLLNGETDDGNAWYASNGVAGHAGLFSTGTELRVLLDLLLAHGSYEGRQYIRTEVIERFLTRDRYQNFLGWMSPNGLPEGSFSHTGFTGTYVLGVPNYGLSIVLLTNRQNMGTDVRGYFPDVGPLQSAVARAIVTSVER